MNRILMGLLISLTLVILFQSETLGCVCVSLSNISLESEIRSQVKTATAVFAGEVTVVRMGEDHTYADMKVSEFWKGDFSEDVTVATDFSSCSFKFEKGKGYLLFGVMVKGYLNIGGCFYNGELSRRTDELSILGKGKVPPKSRKKLWSSSYRYRT